jgi:acyl-CoA synthetase (AMP-forming)/AMP-acid ligase II
LGPPFHDMGLIGGLLTPMAAGFPMRILSPTDFLKAPLWWLGQIGETGTTVTGGPNFAYDLCVRRARTDNAVNGLDLSGWQVAFNGGEPVKQRTLTEFARKFAPAGFRPEAFLPCYGLAEATLMVSCRHWPGTGAGDEPVSCGQPVPDQRLAVVDPETGQPVADRAEGEIWIAGPNVTPGYLNGHDEEMFGTLDGTRFLRTGDLGHLHGGELFITGRAKDVIVYRGVNHHAVDIEAAALDVRSSERGGARATTASSRLVLSRTAARMAAPSCSSGCPWTSRMSTGSCWWPMSARNAAAARPVCPAASSAAASMSTAW